MAEIEADGGTAAACYLDVTKEDTYETLFSAFSMTVTGLNCISIVLLELFSTILLELPPYRFAQSLLRRALAA